MINEQRRRTRRNLSYYMSVLDAKTKKPRGIMTNISMGGFRLDSREPIPPGQLVVSVSISQMISLPRPPWTLPGAANGVAPTL